MIENDNQLKITKHQIESFQNALKLVNAEKAAIESEIKILQEQVREYENRISL